MSDLDKINIYVPESVSLSLNNDASLFEGFKLDGISINRNKFLNLILIGYHDTYLSEVKKKRDLIREQLIPYISDESKMNELVESILTNAILPKAEKIKGKKSRTISLKPINKTETIVRQINDEITNRDYISQYYCRMLMSYCSLPIYEREKIVFLENYNKIMDAINKKRSISFSTIWSNDIHYFIPYDLTAGIDEMFNYLIGVELDEQKNAKEIRAYRLNRITNPEFNIANYYIDEQHKTYLEKMKKYGSQYAINEDEEYCVRLTDHGKKLYNRIYHGRPSYDRIDGDLYYFKCSKTQLFMYFRRFGRDAEIIESARLREEMITFHRNALMVYENKKEEG